MLSLMINDSPKWAVFILERKKMGKRIFIDDQEMTNKDDFDKKVNVNYPLFQQVQELDSLSSVVPQKDECALSMLRINGDNPSNQTYNGSSLLFGMDGTSAIFNVNASFKLATLISTTDNGKSITWEEQIAWKSDIARLEQEIADLKSQISGR